jgi:hypothetical protein
MIFRFAGFSLFLTSNLFLAPSSLIIEHEGAISQLLESCPRRVVVRGKP